MNSTYFKRKEFACRCGCGFDVVDAELLELLTMIREHYQRPVAILSGCRCLAHNTRVGGAKASQHMLGKAVDFNVVGVTPAEVQEFLNNTLPKDKYGVGYGKTFTHLDVRDNPARFHYGP